MRAWIWAAAAASGFGLMLLAYSSRARPDPETPWAYGLIAIGPDGSGSGAPPFRTISTSLRLLPGGERTEMILRAVSKVMPAGATALQAQLQPKLILLPTTAETIGTENLQSGRLPEADGDEILAGSGAPQHTRLTVGKRSLRVVGVLKPDVAVFADCYLITRSEPASDVFPTGDPSVQHATLVRMTPAQSRDRHVLQQLETAYPSPKFAKVMPAGRLGRGVYYLYLAGQAMLLVCGSGVLIRLYHWLADRVRFQWLAAPLREMQRRPRLVWAVHLTYFGLVIVGAIWIYEMPDLQAVLTSAVRAQLVGSGGPLSVAGRAYGSGNILRAAAVTFLVNLPLGSIAVITLPSMVLPGIGAAMAALRALTWGLLLGPTTAWTAYAMLPHSLTMLLEGEGYILAALFGLLIPVHLFQSSLGSTALGRFGRVLLLNIQANAWVALVLALAACYEAIEVISMAG
jgi:hypothetical protein